MCFKDVKGDKDKFPHISYLKEDKVLQEAILEDLMGEIDAKELEDLQDRIFTAELGDFTDES